MRAASHILVAALVLISPRAWAAQPVDIELVLAVDVSASIDSAEQELQRRGVVQAFRDTSVIEAIRSLPMGLAVAVVGFAGATQCRTVVDWHRITDRSSSESFADAVAAAFPITFEFANKTAIGDAIAWSLDELAQNQFQGRAKIDVSGDGQSSAGAHPRTMRDRAIAAGVTINGLAIVNEDSFIAEYYRLTVIGGVGAFVLPAASYDSFGEAIRLKLLRELMPGPTAQRAGAE